MVFLASNNGTTPKVVQLIILTYKKFNSLIYIY